METAPQLLLIGAVTAVGVLHTTVPDHWVPITLMARQRGWSTGETARAALMAGAGHVGSTLVIALLVWAVGAALAERVGGLVDALAGSALVLFGGWIALSAWREQHPAAPHRHGHRHHSDHHGHDGPDHRDDAPEAASDPLYAPLHDRTAVLARHIHLHRHGSGRPHAHWHDHTAATTHAAAIGPAAAPPLHDHRHKTTARTALLLILGSSPMVEGIPAFFAASRYGAGLLIVMAAAFALATIATYVGLCVFSAAGLQRVRLGPFERYGEMLSGALIAAIGIVFLVRPALWPV